MATLETQKRYKIVDTGYIKADRSGTQFSGSTNIVNTGTLIPLNVINLVWSQSTGLDNSPSPGTLLNTSGGVPINVVSNPHPIITIIGIINKTNATDTIRIRYLNQLKKTRGLKCLWYDDEISTENMYTGSIIDELGYDNGSDSHSGNHGLDSNEPHVHVHVKTFTINSNDSSKSFWQYTLILEVDDI